MLSPSRRRPFLVALLVVVAAVSVAQRSGTVNDEDDATLFFFVGLPVRGVSAQQLQQGRVMMPVRTRKRSAAAAAASAVATHVPIQIQMMVMMSDGVPALGDREMTTPSSTARPAVAAATATVVPLSPFSTKLSLADRFTELVSSSTDADADFVERLRQEEHEEGEDVEEAQVLKLSSQQSSTAPNLTKAIKTSAASADTAAAFVWKSTLASILLLGAASFVTTGNHANNVIPVLTMPNAATVWNDLRQAAVAAVAANSVKEAVRWLLSVRQGSWSQSVAQLATQVAAATLTSSRPNLWRHLYETFLPLAARTLRQMLVTEIWNLFFGTLFAAIGTLFAEGIAAVTSSSSSSSSGGGVVAAAAVGDDKAASWDMNFLPTWVTAAVKRGTKKLLQKALQHHLEDALVTIVQYGRGAMQEQVQQLHMFPQFFSPHVAAASAPTTTPILETSFSSSSSSINK